MRDTTAIMASAPRKTIFLFSFSKEINKKRRKREKNLCFTFLLIQIHNAPEKLRMNADHFYIKASSGYSNIEPPKSY